MGNIIETSVFEEMMEAEEGFAEMVELIHEVDGEVITESVEDVLEMELLERENMVDDEEVDVITDHLPEIEKCCTICEFSEPGDGCGANDLSEIEQLEMEAELSVGI